MARKEATAINDYIKVPPYNPPMDGADPRPVSGGPPISDDSDSGPPAGRSPLLSQLSPLDLLGLSGLILMVVYLPFNVEFVLWSSGKRHVFAHYFDFPLLLLVLLSPIFVIKRRPWRGDVVGAVLALLTLLYGVTLAVHPNVRGAQLSYRILAILALATILKSIWSEQIPKIVLGAVVAMGCLEGILSIVQIAVGDTVGLSILGERGALGFIGEAPAAVGTFDHRYRLAGFAAIASGCAIMLAGEVAGRLRKLTLIGLSLSAAPLGLTYSRLAFFAAVAVIIVLLIAAARGRTGYRSLLVVFVVTLGSCIAVTAEGWQQRVAQSTSGSLSADDVTSGRITLTRQALRLIADDPWIGVGPANYMSAVTAAEGDAAITHVHTVPLLIAAEAGILAGAAILVLIGLLGIRAVRAGPGVMCLFVLLLPFLMLEAFPYVTSQGMGGLALWTALISGSSASAGPKAAPL